MTKQEFIERLADMQSYNIHFINNLVYIEFGKSKWDKKRVYEKSFDTMKNHEEELKKIQYILTHEKEFYQPIPRWQDMTKDIVFLVAGTCD